MLIDLNRSPQNYSATTFDVCIVGGGVAGITIALRLERAGRRVLLLEAGARDVSAKSQSFYRGEIGQLENRAPDETRIRALGGSSHHWGGWCRPLDAYDFSRRDLSPDGAWPIGRQDLDPYFEEATRVLSITETKGADLDVSKAGGDLETIRMYFSAPPANLGRKYFDALRQSPNIVVLINAPYVTATFNADRKAVHSISVHDSRTRAQQTFQARMFVFAMGAIENVRHLLTLKRKYGRLGAVGDALGRYYFQHLHQKLGDFVILENKSAPSTGPDILAYLASTEKYLQRKGRGAFRLYSTSFACVEVADGFRQAAAQAACRAVLSTGTVLLTGEQIPSAESRILLSSENDELGLPRIKLDWRIVDEDAVAMREAAMEFGRYLVQSDMGRLKINPLLLNGGNPMQGWTELGSALGAAGHQMGGARMSHSAADGVVDRDCRVWGLDNLYVAGSAVFRTSGHPPPTLTITQLALRLSDTLDRRLRQ